MFVWFVILAMLFGVLAAAGPGIARRGTDNVVVILDRGATMAAISEKGEVFRGVIDAAEPVLAQYFAGEVELLGVPGKREITSISNWASRARAMRPAALDTEALLRQAIIGRLRETRDAVVVLTDRKLGIEDDRLAVIPPADFVRDAGIVRLAARIEPVAQVMVQVRRQGLAQGGDLRLRVISGDDVVERVVPPPPGDHIANYFIDMHKGLGQIVRAELLDSDAASFDDRAWLVRERDWPIIEISTGMPAAVERMVSVYNRARPASRTSPHIVLSAGALETGIRGVSLVGGGSSRAGGSIEAIVSPTVVPHPITENVAHWPIAASDAEAPAGWLPLVMSKGKTCIAVRDGAERQAWVNLDLDAWSQTPDFVIFFTNLLDWVGGGGSEQYVAQPVGMLGDEWTRVDDSPVPAGIEPGFWPGLYRRADGALRCESAGCTVGGAGSARLAPKADAGNRGEEKPADSIGFMYCCSALCVGGGRELAGGEKSDGK